MATFWNFSEELQIKIYKNPTVQHNGVSSDILCLLPAAIDQLFKSRGSQLVVIMFPCHLAKRKHNRGYQFWQGGNRPRNQIGILELKERCRLCMQRRITLSVGQTFARTGFRCHSIKTTCCLLFWDFNILQIKEDLYFRKNTKSYLHRMLPLGPKSNFLLSRKGGGGWFLKSRSYSKLMANFCEDNAFSCCSPWRAEKPLEGEVMDAWWISLIM